MGGKQLLFIYLSTLLLKNRFKALEALLKEWRKDRTNKVLIFTKSVKLLEMLEFHLGAKRKTVLFSYVLIDIFPTGCSLDYGFLKLDGGVKQTDRTVFFHYLDDPCF